MSNGRALMATGITVALVGGVGALSQWPVHDEPEEAVVRLSWRAEPIRVEECRRLTDEEQAGVPAHMRRSEACVGEFVDYELTLTIDGRQALLDTIAPSGLRRDRPVYVLHDEEVAPGRHTVRVRFSALVPDDYVPEDGSTTLLWEDDMHLDPGSVGLVTLDPAGDRLVRGGGA